MKKNKKNLFMKISFSSSFSVVLLLHAICCLLLQPHIVQAQNATTDPDEAAALNAVFARWGIQAPEQWNISGEICSGAALGATPHIDDESYDRLIKCVCIYNNNTRCHITNLRVNEQDITGEIPDEIWTLGYLINLNLGRNLLSGRLSEKISNLTRMQWLNFGVNMLSGELPASLGRLSDLRSIGLGTNFFNGSLPSELGNCRKLQKLYIESAGVSGEIPASFANLKEITTFWAPDNNLTGRIPDFIGNWTQLQSLRFEGNSFNGPIPNSFADLTALTELRISDLVNASALLDFIRNMKSLATLILRNNNLTGSIPSDIGDYGKLTMLDLSFNNLTGEVPPAVFNLGSLSFLFLGNNRLSGSIPTQKSASLLNIDVSYNNLTGSIPSWVNEENLQLNLVANNFTIDNTNSRFLPSGLNCLQRGFPCNRGTPRYSQFAIKCGGPQITSSQNILYESDNETLGPATYYVTSSQRWAVSNVGYPSGTTSHQYKFSSSNDVSNTVDFRLFQTCRLSASSLRYYGLGLEDGNYTVHLEFAELVIPSVNRWWSLGRRAFDVYIQGNRVLKDFDIRRTADGQSNRVVQRNYTVRVSENYLEIHLFWNGRGTCCIPADGTYGPSISAISATPNFIPTVSNRDSSRKKDHTGMIAGIVVGVGTVCLVGFCVVFLIVQKRRRQRALEDEEFLGIDTKPYTFHYSELKAATEDFNAENKLGEGGFGPVYKGKLSDGRVIAVKQLSVKSHQGKSQFVAEIATISAVQHRNLVKLYGCCIEGDHNRLLVYEFLENRSLDQALFGERSLNLDWPTRFEICMGVARGLTYLHEESRLRIVHRDVKASNILLDSQLVPKISDFGLAKLYDDDKTHISTRVAGTIGYLAPEYALRGHLTEKADVFAFGVVALEIISGRRNSHSNTDKEQIYLLEWAWTLHENNREVELLDPKVTEFDEEEVIRTMRVALLCTQTSPMLRPSMSRVIGMLSGDLEVSNVISRPGYLTDWNFQDISGFMSDNPTIGTDTTHYFSSVQTNKVHSKRSNAEPMLHETDDEDDK